MARVLVTRRLPATVEKALFALRDSKGLQLIYHNSEEPIARSRILEVARDGGLSGMYCLLTDQIDSEVIDACGDSLRVVSTMSVGYSHIDVAACTAKGCSVGYTPDVLTDTTADLAVGVLLAAARRIPEAASAVQKGEWSAWKPMWMCGKDVHSSTVGVIGLGRIGAAIAARAPPSSPRGPPP